MEKTKLQTFVKCKEMSQNMEFTKFNDDFKFSTRYFLGRKSKMSFINKNCVEYACLFKSC